MSDPAADELVVVVVCRDCGEHLTFAGRRAERVRRQVATFFTVHPQ
ncbi:MAG: hypothetical protein JJD92_06210 [Frankiaceae bacterium]|nr:hypothetical protein [Frankiaceae bacterium]